MHKLDYAQRRTGGDAAVASRTVTLCLLRGIAPALQGKTCHSSLERPRMHFLPARKRAVWEVSFAGQLFQLFQLPSPPAAHSESKRGLLKHASPFRSAQLPQFEARWSYVLGREVSEAVTRLGFSAHLGILYKTDPCPTKSTHSTPASVGGGV